MIIHLIYLYLIIGIIFIIKNKKVPRVYLGLLIFITFKWIFNYRKCTISWLECKIRGVKREDGYINTILDNIIDVRYNKHIYVITTISLIIIIFELLYNKTYHELF